MQMQLTPPTRLANPSSMQNGCQMPITSTPNISHQSVKPSKVEDGEEGVTTMNKSDGDNIGIKGSVPLQSGQTSSVPDTMPTTTVITTTACTTSAINGCPMQGGMLSTTSIMTTSTTMVTDDNDMKTKDNKRKRDDDLKDNRKSKIRASQEEPDKGRDEMESTKLMKEMFKEVLGIKSTMNTMGGQISAINEKMEIMQRENAVWRQKIVNLESNCTELKSTVEQTQQMVYAETSKRQKGFRDVQEQLKLQAEELKPNTQAIKKHDKQITTLDENFKGIMAKVDELFSNRERLAAPLENLKSKVESALGEVNFPVKKTIVAQNVWFDEDEDLGKKVELIINRTLELPDIKIVNIERKSSFKGVGLVRVELESNEHLKAVLKNK